MRHYKALVGTRMVWSVLATLTVAMMLVRVSHAQSTTGTILGVVADESGARIPAATITITNVDTGLARTSATDESGRYRTANLASGNYEVKAEISGFRTALRRGIQPTVGSETVVDLTLSVGAVAEQVEVTGEAPLVETTSAAVSGVVSDQQVRDLPLNGRSFENLVFLQSGVLPFLQGAKSPEAGEGTKLAMSGSRIDSNSFLLDGTNINDQANMTPGSAAGQLLGVEVLREFRVLTSNYSAEYGRVSGGVVSAVTKSGTNHLHGDAYEYLRNDKLDARNFFDVQKPPFKRNQFGGTAGGRIVKDRTFFFVGYEGFRQRLGGTVLSFVPSAEAHDGVIRDSAGQPLTVGVSPVAKPYLDLFPIPNGPALRTLSGALTSTATYLSNPSQPTRDDFASVRVDQQINADHSFFGRYTIDDGDAQIALKNLMMQGNSTRNQYGTLSETAILSSSAVNVARFGVARSYSLENNVFLFNVPQPLLFFPDQAQLGQITFRTGGLDNFGTTLGLPQRWAHETWTGTDDLTINRGRHSLKMGFMMDRIRENSLKLRVLGGQYFFDDLRGFLQGAPSEINYQPASSDQIRGWRQLLFGGYFQDDVQLRPNLTLNLGLRYEFATVPIEVNGKLADYQDPAHDSAASPHLGNPWFNGSNKDFAPRVGLAWDPFSHGKTSLRAAIGLYHDHIIGSPYNRVIGFVYPYSVTIDVRGSASAPVSFPHFNQSVGAAADPLNQTSFSVAGNLPDPVKVNWTFGIQQEIIRDTVLTATYVGAHSYHQTLSTNGNAAVARVNPANGRWFVPAPAQFRNPKIGQVQGFFSNKGDAYYEGLQVGVLRRMRHGLQAQLSYTWSKTISEMDGVLSRYLNPEGRTGSTVIQNPDNVRGDRSLAMTNFPQAAVVNFSYDLPSARHLHGAAGSILSGWALNSIVTATGGNPLGLVLGFDWTNSRVRGGGNGDRPDLKPGASNSPVLGGPNRYYDPAQFVLPPPNTFGNLGRLTVIGPGLFTWDFSLVKNSPLRAVSESANLQFRAEFFNLMNRANFAMPFNQPLTSNGAIDGRAGVIDLTKTPSRQIQFALKLVF